MTQTGGPQYTFNDKSTEHSFTLPSNIDMGETLESGINFHVFLKNASADGKGNFVILVFFFVSC